MKSIQALREQRNSHSKSLHDLLADNTGDKWKPEHQTVYDNTMAEIDTINAEIGRIEAYEKTMLEEASNENVFDAADKNKNKSRAHELFNQWVRGGDKALNAEEWAEVRNAMSTTTGSEGGYTVQTDVATQIADALAAFGGMRAVSNVIRTTSGNQIDYPTSDGTSETGELIGENTTATDEDITFGTLPLATYKFSSKVVTVPFELLQDSNIDMDAFVSNRLAQRVGRITNTHFTTGTGTGQPNGVVTASGVGKTGTTGQTTTVIADDLIDLLHSVDPAYREAGTCKFMMNDSSLKVIRKLKDTANRPIFLPGYDGLAGPMADTVLGHDIQINQAVAAMAANAKSILFGDFSKYTVRDVMDYMLFRFTDSAYAKKGQVGFLMWARAGGQLTDVGGAVKHYANSAT